MSFLSGEIKLTRSALLPRSLLTEILVVVVVPSCRWDLGLRTLTVLSVLWGEEIGGEGEPWISLLSWGLLLNAVTVNGDAGEDGLIEDHLPSFEKTLNQG